MAELSSLQSHRGHVHAHPADFFILERLSRVATCFAVQFPTAAAVVGSVEDVVRLVTLWANPSGRLVLPLRVLRCFSSKLGEQLTEAALQRLHGGEAAVVVGGRVCTTDGRRRGGAGWLRLRLGR